MKADEIIKKQIADMERQTIQMISKAPNTSQITFIETDEKKHFKKCAEAWSVLIRRNKKIELFKKWLKRIDESHSLYPKDACYDEWEETTAVCFGCRNFDGDPHGLVRKVWLEDWLHPKGTIEEATYINGKCHGLKILIMPVTDKMPMHICAHLYREDVSLGFIQFYPDFKLHEK